MLRAFSYAPRTFVTMAAKKNESSACGGIIDVVITTEPHESGDGGAPRKSGVLCAEEGVFRVLLGIRGHEIQSHCVKVHSRSVNEELRIASGFRSTI